MYAFIIASSQLSLFLWPAHVLGLNPDSPLTELRGLRWWLLGYAVFCGVAPLVNHSRKKRREAAEVAGLFPEFERLQAQDRIAASASAGVSASLLIVTLFAPWVVLLGTAWAITASVLGIRSQAKQVAVLAKDPA